jgi:hypothetical protein
MNVLLIYTYAATGFMMSFMVQRYAAYCLRFLLNPELLLLFERHVIRRRLWRRRTLWGPMGFFRMFLHILHIAGTLVCNAVGVNNWSEASLRAGSLALLHMIPTLISPHLSLVAHYVGVPIPTMNLFHTSSGFMVLLQSAIHVIITVKTVSFDVTNRQMQHGLVVSLPCIAARFMTDRKAGCCCYFATSTSCVFLVSQSGSRDHHQKPLCISHPCRCYAVVTHTFRHEL